MQRTKVNGDSLPPLPAIRSKCVARGDGVSVTDLRGAVLSGLNSGMDQYSLHACTVQEGTGDKQLAIQIHHT